MIKNNKDNGSITSIVIMLFLITTLVLLINILPKKFFDLVKKKEIYDALEESSIQQSIVKVDNEYVTFDTENGKLMYNVYIEDDKGNLERKRLTPSENVAVYFDDRNIYQECVIDETTYYAIHIPSGNHEDDTTNTIP